MKQKDIALIIAVAFFAGIFSLVISKFFFTSEGNRNVQAEVVEPISPDFNPPDNRVFNDKAINPTKLIQIGDNKNKQPF